ncbi:MAG: hypothetical protein V4553_06030 [Bacteroidota bacterium]
MMITVFFLIVFVFIIVQYIINPTKGIFIYILLSLFFPYITLFSVVFRFELLIVPFLLIITLIKKKKDLVIPVIFIVWFVFVIYCGIVSFFSVPFVGSSSVNFIEFYNYLRFGGLILIGANADFSNEGLYKLNRFFFFLSVPIALLALGLAAGNSLASSITQNFYTSPSRPVFDNQMAFIDIGYSFRSIGVFENVSYYASYILVILSLGLSFVLNKQLNNKSVKAQLIITGVILLNLIAGISASSLTFYVGALFIISYFFVKRPLLSIKLISGMLIIATVIGAFFYTQIINSIQQYLDVFQYLYQSFLGGDKLTERYSLAGREYGDLTQIIQSKWLLGNGFRYYDKIVVNDSLYLEFFYQAGLIGTLILVMFIGLMFFNTIKKRAIKAHRIYLIFLIILITGIGCNSISIVRMSEWLWIIMGITVTAKFKAQDTPYLQNITNNDYSH